MVIRKLSISGIVLSSNRFTLAGVEVEGAAVVECAGSSGGGPSAHRCCIIFHLVYTLWLSAFGCSMAHTTAVETPFMKPPSLPFLPPSEVHLPLPLPLSCDPFPKPPN